MGITRRSLLTGAGLWATAGLLAGCRSEAANTLQMRVLKGSIPAQMVKRFHDRLRKTAGDSPATSLKITPASNLADLFTLLQTLKQPGDSQPANALPLLPRSVPSPVLNLVTLGDYWLATAIAQGLIQPLDSTSWQQWSTLPERWQNLVIRDNNGKPDVAGKVWAAPYSWGTTMIIYRADRFAAEGWQPPTNWADLWRSDLKGWISLPDNAREVIGLTLKHLGHSYNTPDLRALPELESQLIALNQQAKLYSSNNYLQPLILGDTAVAVGWSTDILPLIRSDRAAYAPGKRQYAAVVPTSGTALWANLWVQPAGSTPNSILQTQLNQWIDFCWQSDVAPQLSLLSGATSPIVLTMDPTTLPANLNEEPLLLPSTLILDNSDFLLPLEPETIEQYHQLWQKMRRSNITG